MRQSLSRRGGQSPSSGGTQGQSVHASDRTAGENGRDRRAGFGGLREKTARPADFVRARRKRRQAVCRAAGGSETDPARRKESVESAGDNARNPQPDRTAHRLFDRRDRKSFKRIAGNGQAKPAFAPKTTGVDHANRRRRNVGKRFAGIPAGTGDAVQTQDRGNRRTRPLRAGQRNPEKRPTRHRRTPRR